MITLLIATLMLLALVLAFFAGWLLVAWLVVKRPILGIPIAIYIAFTAWLGAHDAQALAIYALTALAIWRLLHKHSYQRLVGQRLRSAWRRLWIYDRRWHATMVLTELAKPYHLRRRVPKIRSVQSTPTGDRILIDLVPGQRTEEIERAAPALAHSFGAHSCHVTEDRPGRLCLLLIANNPEANRTPHAHDTPVCAAGGGPGRGPG